MDWIFIDRSTLFGYFITLSTSIMWIEGMRDFFSNLDLCEICILRYKNTDLSAFENSLTQLDITPKDKRKRQKANVCFACLGIFQENVANEIVEHSNLCMYECNSIYSSISVPISILIHDLSIWIELIRKFPENITDSKINCKPFRHFKEIQHMF